METKNWSSLVSLIDSVCHPSDNSVFYINGYGTFHIYLSHYWHDLINLYGAYLSILCKGSAAV